MPDSPEERKRAITRLRRIRGQAEALERHVNEGTTCGNVLQQLAAMRGAINGLMSDVLEGHLRETFGVSGGAPLAESEAARIEAVINEAAALVRSYLK